MQSRKHFLKIIAFYGRRPSSVIIKSIRNTTRRLETHCFVERHFSVLFLSFVPGFNILSPFVPRNCIMKFLPLIDIFSGKLEKYSGVASQLHVIVSHFIEIYEIIFK